MWPLQYSLINYISTPSYLKVNYNYLEINTHHFLLRGGWEQFEADATWNVHPRGPTELIRTGIVRISVSSSALCSTTDIRLFKSKCTLWIIIMCIFIMCNRMVVLHCWIIEYIEYVGHVVECIECIERVWSLHETVALYRRRLCTSCVAYCPADFRAGLEESGGRMWSAQQTHSSSSSTSWSRPSSCHSPRLLFVRWMSCVLLNPFVFQTPFIN